ncbi:RNA-binding protein [Neisseria lactamica]|uniref:RNA-binding protein n=1 Tax=Neisseria lactamica TaxID=486 RepID=A0AAU8VEW5_NEILA|nr:RNA-binding protein [Neisseria lactamica]
MSEEGLQRPSENAPPEAPSGFQTASNPYIQSCRNGATIRRAPSTHSSTPATRVMRI